MSLFKAQEKTWSKPQDISQLMDYRPILKLAMNGAGDALVLWEGADHITRAMHGKLVTPL